MLKERLSFVDTRQSIYITAESDQAVIIV